uniref:non-specific serine/threonine protein kinase n=1 Tax=Plagiogyria distinctissima TaxID=659591 RepID=D8L1V5_9MONI|nr:phytochrome 3 [Plagiogyria distinctissima]
MSAKTKHSVRVAQTSADARLHAAFEGSRSGAGAGDVGGSDYSKSGRPSASGHTEVAPEAITAYLQRMQRGGLTQAFGCLLVVAGNSILALSENAPEMLEMTMGLSTDLRMLFTSDSTAALEQAAKEEDLSSVNPVLVQSCNGSGQRFYAVLHRIEDVKGLVMDLEPIEGGPGVHVEERSSAEMAIAQIQSLPGGDIGRLCQAVVEEVQEMTGYDRVMAYKFHEDEHGEVVAEMRRPELEPYLGLHYPSTDVPQASRMMFMKNGVRMIGDCTLPPVRVVQAKELAQPISLAGSTLRAPHGCHAQYMRNMGSAASLTMAVVIDDYEDYSSLSGSRKLWGLVVCHHTSPRKVSYPLRCACQKLMEAFGVQLNMELEFAAQLREQHILTTQTLLCDMLRRIRGAPIGIVSRSPSIMDLVKCDGAALYYGGKMWPLGTTPSEFQVQDLAEWLLGSSEEIASSGVTCTDSLAEAGYPGAAALGDAVCGMAAARITPNSDFLFWFRSHTAKEVFWGGAEHDPQAKDDDSRLLPRSSFHAFLEIVKRRSLPWEEVEVDAIRSLQLILKEDLEEFCAAAAAGADGEDVDSLVPASKKLSLKESEEMGGAENSKKRERATSAAVGAAGGTGGAWEKMPLPPNLAQEWMEAIRGTGDGGTGGGPFDWDSISVFQQTSFVVVDALKPDLPIIFASTGFFNLTGYTYREVLAGNCRFLQGPDTNPADVASIREALAPQGTGTFCGRLLNYRKDGSNFWNLLTIAPIKDDSGTIVKFIGVQLEVSKYTEGSRANRLRPNGLPQSLIKYDVRHQDKVSALVAQLVAALTKPHKVDPPKSRPSYPMRVSSLTGQTIEPLSLGRAAPARPYSTSDVPPTVSIHREGKGRRRHRSSTFLSLLGMEEKDSEEDQFPEPELIMVDDALVGRPRSLDDPERTRRGIDLATTLERIGHSFVITDPRLPDNPIIFASDQFLELTEYSREDVLGENCRFLQGRDTDLKAVQLIRDAVKEGHDVTVHLLNYTRSGRPFWNLFHLQAMRDKKGNLQYFIGVQQETDMPDRVEQEKAKVVRAAAENVDLAARELPDANLTPDHLWERHSKEVTPLPHSKINSPCWYAILRVQRRLRRGERLGLKHFRPIKPLGSGDTGSVHLVELRGTGQVFALKAMDKSLMLHRNKVHRARVEREILGMMDHPFLPTLYASFQTKTHVCLVMDFCPRGDLFLLQDKQPNQTLSEEAARFYAAEVVVALEYLHCMGVIYRDLKPENLLLQKNGHILLTDFDLSFLTSCRPQLMTSGRGSRRRIKKRRARLIFCAEPRVSSNSFVGTEEYIAPEIISGHLHSSAVDWWALGILLYEMLYGQTPFCGSNRQKTFMKVLSEELTFPTSISVCLAGKQLIAGLLQRDPAIRLGAFRGASDVKKHPFFQGIDWPLIRCSMKPPYNVHNLATPSFDEF